MANWEVSKRYRGRAVPGQIQVEKIESTGTPYVAALVECTVGEMQSQRMRWRGYLNSPSNIADTIDALRAMGWRGAKLGDWQGIGTKDVDFTATADDGKNQEGKATKFWTAAFVRPPAALKEEKAVGLDELAALNALVAGAVSATPPNGAARPAPGQADPWDQEPEPALSGGG